MTTLRPILASLLARLRLFSRLDPARDWIVLLIISMMALVCIVVWNVWAFDTVSRGGTLGTPATSTPLLFDRSSLDAVHAIFVNRAAEEEKYISGGYSFTDPSQ